MPFCHNCGKKIEKGDNFCEGCGKSFKKVVSHTNQSKRPSFLTVWLILMIIANIPILIYYLLGSNFHTISDIIFVLFKILNFVFIIALFNWKRWGFYGYITLSTIGSILTTLFYNYFYFGFYWHIWEGIRSLRPSLPPGGMVAIHVILVVVIALTYISIIILYLAMKPVWEKFK